MSGRYKTGDNDIPHFVTFTVVGWLDVFSREEYKEKLLESLKYCQQEKGLLIHAWVIMTNHVHLIISSKSYQIYEVIRDLKKYTSRQIIQAIKDNPYESRKEWLLNMFAFVAKRNHKVRDYQFWQHGYHPVELNNEEMLEQRLGYLHDNPVRSGMVWESWHYKYSSAIDYCTLNKGLLQIEHIDG